MTEMGSEAVPYGSLRQIERVGRQVSGEARGICRGDPPRRLLPTALQCGLRMGPAGSSMMADRRARSVGLDRADANAWQFTVVLHRASSRRNYAPIRKERQINCWQELSCPPVAELDHYHGRAKAARTPPPSTNADENDLNGSASARRLRDRSSPTASLPDYRFQHRPKVQASPNDDGKMPERVLETEPLPKVKDDAQRV